MRGEVSGRRRTARPRLEARLPIVAWIAGLTLGACGEPADIPPNAIVPSAEQVAYQKQELIGFVHFTVNTFTDREWGYGDEPEAVFAPTALDADQWASVAAAAGMKELILTAKHHDGFCLWPSAYTEHSVKNSPWRDGEGDVLRELVDAARSHGLRVGFYLSPWDRNRADYGTPAYIEYYRNQLRELLTGYGDVTELWFDGANGGTGWYGGADEERRIDRTTYYDWPNTWGLVKSIQPATLIFSDAGPDIRWIGNERGWAGETNWSMLDTDRVTVGAADSRYLNTGDADGTSWVVPLCDVSIRPGWFYHPTEDDRVKSPETLVDTWYRSVGRNCVLLLNVPPDTRGRFHENDVAALREFRRILDETFATNLAAGAEVTTGSRWRRHAKFAPANLVDDDADSYWAAADGTRTEWLEIDLGERTRFDRILLREPIRLGQRIERFTIEAGVGDQWTTIAQGTTIGYKRVLRVPAATADRVRILIEASNNVPALSNFGIYLASPDEPVVEATTG